MTGFSCCRHCRELPTDAPRGGHNLACQAPGCRDGVQPACPDELLHIDQSLTSLQIAIGMRVEQCGCGRRKAVR